VDDVVVDASVFVSRLLRTDPNHSVTCAWFESRDRADGLLVVPALMPPEVAGAIGRRIRDSRVTRRAVEKLLRIPALRVVAVDRALSGRAMTLAAELRLRGADAIYVAVAQRLELPLVTWDREQHDRSGQTISARRPTV